MFSDDSDGSGYKDIINKISSRPSNMFFINLKSELKSPA